MIDSGMPGPSSLTDTTARPWQWRADFGLPAATLDSLGVAAGSTVTLTGERGSVTLPVGPAAIALGRTPSLITGWGGLAWSYC